MNVMLRYYYHYLRRSWLYRTVKRTLQILLLLWWLLLSHVSCAVAPDKPAEDACFMHQDPYRIAVESPAPVNPFGIWLTLRYLKDQPYYLVVYDDQGHYIGQSSPTLHNDRYDQPNPKKTNVCNFIDVKNNKIIVPGDNVTVPLHHKKWWSWILQFIN